MTDELSPAEQAERAEGLSHFCSLVILAGETPGVASSVLADLMAKFLVCHKSKNESPVEEAETRARVLAQWCETVWQIVAVYDGKGEPRH
jgi:hypothetical protein